MWKITELFIDFEGGLMLESAHKILPAFNQFHEDSKAERAETLSILSGGCSSVCEDF